MPRLFTGIKIPASVAEHLRLMQYGLSGAKWIEAEDFHITLRFFGDVDGVMADEIIYGYESIQIAPFSLRLSGIGHFGKDKPRMIWAGVKDSEDLQHLHMAHENLAQKLGLKPEGRKFIPHVTLARLRHGNMEEVSNYLHDHGLFETQPFEVTAFVLFSARSSRGGGPYQTEAIYPFD